MAKAGDPPGRQVTGIDLGGRLRAARNALPARYRAAVGSSRPARWLRRGLERLEFDRDLALRDGPRWSRSRPCPRQLYDAGGAQIGPLLYVVCGYISMDSASDDILVFDMRRQRWVGRIPTPPGLAHSHCAVAGDDARFVYLASGQLGPQCRPAVRTAFAYDTVEDRWHELPPVPAARYAASMQLWRGRLHLIGGAAEDRWTPTADHWSLGVSGGRATEDHWRPEAPAPVAGMHRASAVVEDCLYLFGGQQGDFRAIPGDPDCRCSPATRETYLACAFRLDDPSGRWERRADLPVATSHCDFGTIVADGRVLLLGGQVYKHPDTFYLRLSDAIQCYDTRADRWTIAGHLPYRLKIPVVGCLGDRMFVTTGQRGKGAGDRPGPITCDTWTAMLPPATPERATTGALGGKSVLMVSHDLSRTGSPLLLMETARAIIDRGVSVRLATAADDGEGWNLASEFCIPHVPIETARPLARDADLVVANTTDPRMTAWVRGAVGSDPALAKKLVWWVHEIDTDLYAEGTEPLATVALALFDSAAARTAWAEAARLPPDARVIHPALSADFLDRTERPSLPFSQDPRRDRSGRSPSLSRERMRARLGVGPGDFLVCSIGTFLPAKGQRLLIRTVARAAEDRGVPLKLLVVGLKNRDQRAGLLSRLTPGERRVLAPSRAYVAQSDIAAFYRASDAFVMNSQGGATGRGECFGRVTIEAMAFGLPVLGTAAGGTAEIVVDGDTGLLFPVGYAGQAVLADHLERLARDPALTQRLGRAGRARALDRFHERRFLGEFEQALASVAGAQAAPAHDLTAAGGSANGSAAQAR